MSDSNSKDVILIGAGVLSTTFGSFLKDLAPDWNIKLLKDLRNLQLKVQTNEIMLVLDMPHYVS